jgi:hypothetical protein
MDRSRLRAVMKRLHSDGMKVVPIVVAELRDLGAVRGIHQGKNDLTPDETVEWYAGQTLDILENEAWWAVNTLCNVLDKFVPKEAPETVDQLLAAIRAHPHFEALLCQFEVDMREGLDPEVYEGESDERSAIWALLYELLAGKKPEVHDG